MAHTKPPEPRDERPSPIRAAPNPMTARHHTIKQTNCTPQQGPKHHNCTRRKLNPPAGAATGPCPKQSSTHPEPRPTLRNTDRPQGAN
eukprot:2119423-Alexandrium_andersonii.AAC.1